MLAQFPMVQLGWSSGLEAFLSYRGRSRTPCYDEGADLVQLSCRIMPLNQELSRPHKLISLFAVRHVDIVEPLATYVR